MIKYIAINLLALSMAGLTHADDNPVLTKIYETDQAVRKRQPIDWTFVTKQDEMHRARVLELLKSQEIVTANDFLHAAMVMQHGNTFEDYRLALSLATVASTIDPQIEQARWLSAAAWDRALMQKDVPQYQSSPGAKTTLYKVDERAVTDEERKSLGVPSLQQAKDFLKEINGEP
jgi:hypothetical protein